ncbi:hypothetical protein, partial [Salmonella enterica]|uniref:hypothetical protein n=1 Tax=Salmonella enterica TaxID=28901 RepID=UPI00398C529E
GRLLTALITEGGDVAGFKERVDCQITPLMDVTTRAERQAIRDHLATMQADAIHAANFTDVVSIQHALDLIAERWTQQA